MLILSSSAKTLDMKANWPKCFEPLVPKFQSVADQLMKGLSKMELKDLQSVLGVSEKIAITNAERNQAWVNWPAVWEEEGVMHPALFCYKGDVFRELQIEKYRDQELAYAGRSVFVSSGLYGIVGAQDGIQAYRLEMNAVLPALQNDGKTKGKGRVKMNAYWKEKVTTHLNDLIEKSAEGADPYLLEGPLKDSGALPPHQFFLNLASIEYASAVDRLALKVPVIDIEFKEEKEGELKTVGIFAKRARGMMIDYCIRHKVETPNQLRGFTTAGYELISERVYDPEEKKGQPGSLVMTFAR